MAATALLSAAGTCPCCRQEVTFTATGEYLRDSFRCPECDSVPRERALMATLDRFFPWWPNATIHESSPVSRGASARIASECRYYHATQHWSDRDPGAYVGRVRNEDLEGQTYASGTFDLVVTQDVMEHVFDPDAAFREIARTLKPGGAHVFTTPLVNQARPSQQAARRAPGGEIVHLVEPEYHGNPIGPDGSLVTWRWGYDIVEHIYRASGLFSTIVYIDDLSQGIRAELNEVIVTRKGGATRG